MNDRFKIRVWDKNKKTYAVIPYGNYALADNGGLLWLRSDYDCVGINTEDFVIEQCTGLKDKNGKLIFENDVLDDDFVVVWADFGWGIKRSGVVTMFQANMTHFEVTSNIHKIRSYLND